MEDIVKERVKKLEEIKRKGFRPYGMRFEKTLSAKQIVENFAEGEIRDDKGREGERREEKGKEGEIRGDKGKEVQFAGRITAIRSHGKSVFADLKDQSGKIQIYLKGDTVGEEAFGLFGNLDIGDFIGGWGGLFKTRTGEVTINVKKFVILSKSLRPLPEKWHGLKDVETRYRQRYLDLISDDKVKDIFILRTEVISKIREFFDKRGYLEVETPMMQAIPGGAAGKPFKTHHNIYDIDLFLRIAPELYLKRLLVGGFEKVYEINKSFRNEGISTRHNPEFTMLEAYTAYADYNDMMKLTEDLVTFAAKEVLGRLDIEFQGKKIDLSKWEKVSFADLMETEFEIKPDEGPDDWAKKLKKKGIELEKGKLSRTKMINIISELIEPKAGAHPIFVTDLFTELCPLAKVKEDNPLLSERFELFIGGMEVANAYSELNDPLQQRQRFKEQQKEWADAEKIDEDFITALEYGMPPAGGLGIGIDRLVMILANAPSIREVILFPQLKPER